MLLGDVLQRLGDEAFAAETLIGLGDLALVVEVEAMGRRFDETLSEYAADATRRFTAFASHDDWLALMAALDRAPDPGASCLRHMLVWSLRRDGDDGKSTSRCGSDCKGA